MSLAAAWIVKGFHRFNKLDIVGIGLVFFFFFFFFASVGGSSFFSFQGLLHPVLDLFMVSSSRVTSTYHQVVFFL